MREKDSAVSECVAPQGAESDGPRSPRSKVCNFT